MTCSRCDGNDPVLACTCDEQFSKHYTYRNVDKPPEERRMKTREEIELAIDITKDSIGSMEKTDPGSLGLIVAKSVMAAMCWVLKTEGGEMVEFVLNNLDESEGHQYPNPSEN